MKVKSSKEFGHFLKEARQKKGLSQDELGAALKFTGQFISNLERGIAPLPLPYLKKIIDQLSLDEHFVVSSLISI
jgi:transcriptional regulator with XRE-family HTH domain